jgi:hypothetical protein
MYNKASIVCTYHWKSNMAMEKVEAWQPFLDDIFP